MCSNIKKKSVQVNLRKPAETNFQILAPISERGARTPHRTYAVFCHQISKRSVKGNRRKPAETKCWQTPTTDLYQYTAAKICGRIKTKKSRYWTCETMAVAQVLF